MEQQGWLILAQGAHICSLFLGFLPLTAKVSCDSHTFSVCHLQQAAQKQGWAPSSPSLGGFDSGRSTGPSETASGVPYFHSLFN